MLEFAEAAAGEEEEEEKKEQYPGIETNAFPFECAASNEKIEIATYRYPSVVDSWCRAGMFSYILPRSKGLPVF